MRKSLLLVLRLVPCFQSCAGLAVGAGVGMLASSEMNNNVYVGQLPASGSTTWAQTKVTLSNLSLKPIAYDNEAMRATADVDGATVVVECSVYDLEKSEIKVSAKKYMVNNGEIAKLVFDKIVADLNGQR
jgi:hypothetical protein